MKNIILITILLLSYSSFAQKKSEIIQYGIEVKREYEQDLSEGDKEPILTKEEFYNTKGEMVELKEYKDKNIDKWVKYKYDFETNLIEETELNSKGEQIERTEYKYDKGLKMEKLSYDDKNRLEKIRKYEYGIRQ